MYFMHEMVLIYPIQHSYTYVMGISTIWQHDNVVCVYLNTHFPQSTYRRSNNKLNKSIINSKSAGLCHFQFLKQSMWKPQLFHQPWQLPGIDQHAKVREDQINYTVQLNVATKLFSCCGNYFIVNVLHILGVALLFAILNSTVHL